MSREEAVSLLTELVSVCRTFLQAPVVYLTKDVSGKWGLNVKWATKGQEKECLERLARQHGYSVAETGDFTIIQKL